jgi:hypothetical protein
MIVGGAPMPNAIPTTRTGKMKRMSFFKATVSNDSCILPKFHILRGITIGMVA